MKPGARIICLQDRQIVFARRRSVRARIAVIIPFFQRPGSNPSRTPFGKNQNAPFLKVIEGTQLRFGAAKVHPLSAMELDYDVVIIGGASWRRIISD